MIKALLVLIALLTAVGCKGFVPTPSRPCPNLFCEEWHIAGVDVMICAETPETVKAKVNEIKARSVSK